MEVLELGREFLVLVEVHLPIFELLARKCLIAGRRVRSISIASSELNDEKEN